MKKRNTRIITLMIVVIIMTAAIILLFKILFGDSDVKNLENDDITCREWLEMLYERMGIIEEEWEPLALEAGYEGADYATGEFIAMTAMKAIGQNKIQICLGVEVDITDGTYIELAITCGLIEEQELSRGVSRERANTILDKLGNLYYGEFWREDVSEVKYQNGVVEAKAADILWHNEDYSEIIATEAANAALSEGSVIVFEQDNTGLKMARKIIGINENDTLTLGNVELEEVVDSLVVSDITLISFGDIVRYYGAEDPIVRKDAEEVRAVSAALKSSMKLESKGFKISLFTTEENGGNQLSVTITDYDSGVTYQLPFQVEMEQSCYAEVEVDRIYVATQMKYTALSGVEYAEVALDAHATLKGGVQGKLFDEKKILLFETPAPLGNGFVGVNIQIYLVISAEGEITIEAGLPLQADIRYEKGYGIRNIKQNVSVQEPTIKAECEVSIMLRVQPTLVILMCVDVIDAQVDIGAKGSVEAVLRTNKQLCTDISVVFPVFTISICGDDDTDTLVGMLGLSAEWEIISAEDAPIQFGFHHELLANGVSQIVEKCTYQEGETEYTEENISPHATAENRKEEVRGNTNGNIVNGGYVAKQDDWLFYGITGGLYKEKTDGTEKQQLCVGDCFEFINVVDDWVYYVTSGRDSEDGMVFTVSLLGRIKIDGTEGEILGTIGFSMHIIDDVIYTNTYKGNLDGLGMEQIYERYAVVPTMSIKDGWIYFTDTDISYKADSNLYKVRTDGSERQLLIEGNIKYVDVAGDWIYFVEYSEDMPYSRNMYRAKTDGTDQQKLVDGVNIANINVLDDWIYYTVGLKEIYKIKTDGTKNQMLYSVDQENILIAWLNIIDDYIYYGSGPNTIYRLKTDGSEPQVFAKWQIH